MLKAYPRFKRGQVEGIVWDNLPHSEKAQLEKYLIYRQARGLKSKDKLYDVKRYLLHLRHILEKEFKKITLNDLREMLAIINTSDLSASAKNHIKTDFSNFLKYLFPDWSIKFSNFDDVKLDSSRNSERINSKNIINEDEIKKLLEAEKNLFWKAFLLVQFEAGLRTIEVRTLKWSDVSLNSDKDLTEINIYSTKNEKARSVFVKESTYYLERLKAEQENLDNKGIYVFHSKKDINKPIDKFSVSYWFRTLTKKVLGRQGWNYLLRHSRATQLYRLAKEGKISKDTAVKFMGHTKDMSDTYTHLDKEDVKKMLKEQIYNKDFTKLPEKTKHKLEREIENLKKMITAELPELRDAISKLIKREKGSKFKFDGNEYTIP